MENKLAILRTKWAAERTWLAQVRASLALAIASFTAYHLLMISCKVAAVVVAISLAWLTLASILYIIRIYRLSKL